MKHIQPKNDVYLLDLNSLDRQWKLDFIEIYFILGANGYLDHLYHYKPQITSYGYDAPISEAGDPTEKYFAIRKTLSEVCISLSSLVVTCLQP